ncbi:hypothetical protein JKP88DRAFT_282864 [Tribonema minus]|uniref:Uncharacterized protein n=1 Tax=Tribonema minus TaxID=303371 RepID=A0A835YKV6_9STRA|nr:hypothetical protein JKP88DRAFT_282864 [Tribonema minus]
MCVAARHGHLVTLQWLMKKGELMFGRAQQYVPGDLCSKYCDSERWVGIASPLDAAAFGGHRHIVVWLHRERSHAFTKHTLPLAVQGGNRVALLKWLVAQGCPCRGIDLSQAMDHDGNSVDSYDSECNARDLDLLSHLERALAPLVRLPWRGSPGGGGAAQWAYITRVSRTFRGMYMHVLASRPYGKHKLFLTAERTAVFSQTLIDYAVANRLPHPPGSQFRRELGDDGRMLTWIAQQIRAAGPLLALRAALMCAAARHGHLATLQWLMDEGVPKWLVAEGCPWDRFEVEYAARCARKADSWAYIARVNRAFRGVYMYVLASMPHGIYELFLTSERTAVYSEALIDYAVAEGLWPGRQFRRKLGRMGSLQLIRYAAEAMPGMSVDAEVLIGLMAKLNVPLLRQVQTEFYLPDLSLAFGVKQWCAAGLEAAAAGDDGRMLTWIAQQIRALRAALMCAAARHGHLATLWWLMDEGVSKFGRAQQYRAPLWIQRSHAFTKHTLPIAIEGGNRVALLEWLVAEGCPSLTECWRETATPLDAAAFGGRRHIIDWLCPKRSHAFTWHTLPLATLGGNGVVLLPVEWLVAEGCPRDRFEVEYAARSAC